MAHVDMPVETGHTLYLPGSQSCLPGYFAHTRPEFQEYFDQHHVQLPLAKGGTMEQVDRARMCRALHPTLRTLSNPANAIAACAESYPFPTNLGRAPPTGSLAPNPRPSYCIRPPRKTGPRKPSPRRWTRSARSG